MELGTDFRSHFQQKYCHNFGSIINKLGMFQYNVTVISVKHDAHALKFKYRPL